MTRPYHMYLLLERFLTDYHDLLVSFSLAYAPAGEDHPSDPRCLKSHRELPYICFLLKQLREHPQECLKAAEEHDLIRQLARELDSYEQNERRQAA